MVKSSILTGERLAKIETTLEYIKQKQDDNDVDHALLLKRIDDFIEKADSRYASKLVERIVYALIGLISVGVVTALLKLVFV